MKPPVHRLLQRFSEKYGPIFSLRYGSSRVVVITSLSLVQESFTGTNDVILSSRPLQLTAKYVGYNHTTVGTAPYGDHWRNLRRIFSLEILSSNRLTSFLYIRKDEIRRMLTRLSRDAHSDDDGSRFTHVELEPLLSDLTFNNIVRLMVAGKRYYGDDVDNKEEQSGSRSSYMISPCIVAPIIQEITCRSRRKLWLQVNPWMSFCSACSMIVGEIKMVTQWSRTCFLCNNKSQTTTVTSLSKG
ncbi:hypothetical protein YC2023_079123 [Brassica napus]